MFGRATIRLGIGPHSSFCCFMGCISALTYYVLLIATTRCCHLQANNGKPPNLYETVRMLWKLEWPLWFRSLAII